MTVTCQILTINIIRAALFMKLKQVLKNLLQLVKILEIEICLDFT